MHVIINEDGQLLTKDNGDFHCDLSEAAKFETLEEAEGILTEVLTQYRGISDPDTPEEYSWMSIIEMSVISDMDSLGLVHLDKDGNKLMIGDIITTPALGAATINSIDDKGVSITYPDSQSIYNAPWSTIRKHWRLRKENED